MERTGKELVIREKESVYVNNTHVYNTFSFIKVFLINLLYGSGFACFVGDSTALGHSKSVDECDNRVHFILREESKFSIEIYTLHSKKVFSDGEKDDFVAHGVLCCEWVRNFIVSNLRQKTHTITFKTTL